MAKHHVDPASILEQQTNDEKRKAPVNDDDAVAQRLEAVQPNERERAREDPGHQRNEQDGRQRGERADKCADPKKDDDAAEKGDLAYIKRRKAEIGEAFSHYRIAQQHDSKQGEIPVALGERTARYSLRYVGRCGLRVGHRCHRLIVPREHRRA